MAEEIVRVLRVIEYVGERSNVESTVSRSMQGEKQMGGLTIRAATIGTYPEILETPDEEKTNTV
jgi:hypothetical protein